MTFALSFSRGSLAVAAGILIGAGAAMIGIEVATHGCSAAHEVALVAPAQPPTDPLTIIDVSRSGIARTGGVGSLAEMLHVGPGRTLVSINGQRTDQVDLATAWEQTRSGEYLDLQLLSPGLPSLARIDRVLVLVHP